MKRWLKPVLTTGLAWLGLAGLTDNIVEWQNWFEVGIMQHWRSVKTWIIAVLLDWVPFRVPSWGIDWLVVGSIHMRAAMLERIKILELKFVRPYETTRSKVAFRVLAAALNTLWLLLFWPLPLGLNVYDFLNEYSREDQKMFSIIRRAKGWERSPYWREDLANAVANDSTRRQIVSSIVLFIPILFVCSTVLYEFG
jgi:hypothetical protein